MNATHEVQVWNHKGSWRTRWYACEVIGRHPAPSSWLSAGLTPPLAALLYCALWAMIALSSAPPITDIPLSPGWPMPRRTRR